MARGRGGPIGDTVARFPDYESAQKAVSKLIAAEVPAREIAIVGIGLRSVERVTGRLGYATAARAGAVNGLLLGMFFAAILVLGGPLPIQAFVGVLFLGIALGMLMSIVAYSLVRRRRDYASVMQVVADHYDVTVASASIHKARQAIGSPAPVSQPAPAPLLPSDAPPAEEPAPGDRPRYGERIAPPDVEPAAAGEPGEREAPPSP